jgi:hypothetical protein
VNFGAIEVNVGGEGAIVMGMWKKGDRGSTDITKVK